MQLHRDLYSYFQGESGGSYKNSDNIIDEIDTEGQQKARFIPVPAVQTSDAMDELYNKFSGDWDAGSIDKVRIRGTCREQMPLIL